jgi:hypothetical protein
VLFGPPKVVEGAGCYLRGNRRGAAPGRIFRDRIYLEHAQALEAVGLTA